MNSVDKFASLEIHYGQLKSLLLLILHPDQLFTPTFPTCMIIAEQFLDIKHGVTRETTSTNEYS